ncbi:MAG: hypothetical protein LBU18_05200, partial [Treponema sp.]|nr:hypothetical protein [Treponema sp.]
LRFELKYQAFGTEDSGGKDWFIRNGLVRAGADSVKKADAGGSAAGGGSGGKFVIRFGEGIPETIGVPVSTDLDE